MRPIAGVRKGLGERVCASRPHLDAAVPDAGGEGRPC